MTSSVDRAKEYANAIQEFPLGNCNPSDDPDKQYAYTAAFRDIAVRFVGAIKRIGDPNLSSLVADLDTEPERIEQAHALRARLSVVVDAFAEATSDPGYAATASDNAAFLNPDVLRELREVPSPRLDTRKLVKMCVELNDAYARANYIKAALLLRAIQNHVPPVFRASNFAEAVANRPKSIRESLSRLNNEARPISDLHNHLTMRETEWLPTKHQLEAFKPAFELLIQEVRVALYADPAT